MKSQRRHELQQNDLAEWLGRLAERVRPYARTLLVVGTAALVVVAVSLWLMRRSAAKEAAAWDAVYAKLQNPAELERVAEQHAGTDAAAWARVTAADMYLAVGCDQLFVNKAIAIQELQKAIENYLAVLEMADTDELQERATFGLARAYEALAGTRQGQGELDKAIEQYEKLTATWPEGVYAQLAKQRLEDLQRRQTKAFYDAFAQFEPKPAFSEAEPGSGPVFDPSNVPDTGQVPDLLGGAADAKPSPATDQNKGPATGQAAEPGSQSPESEGRAQSAQSSGGAETGTTSASKKD